MNTGKQVAFLFLEDAADGKAVSTAVAARRVDVGIVEEQEVTVIAIHGSTPIVAVVARIVQRTTADGTMPRGREEVTSRTIVSAVGNSSSTRSISSKTCTP
ncbi:MAG: hypothetical protein LBB85_04395 [Dysgonamonadaceae bacterium]|nr:hypothetical protein [Dysgonamonadaceae bacterium]